ncbi:MAG: hypothetical protein ACK4G3_00715 [bacterium]
MKILLSLTSLFMDRWISQPQYILHFIFLSLFPLLIFFLLPGHPAEFFIYSSIFAAEVFSFSLVSTLWKEQDEWKHYRLSLPVPRSLFLISMTLSAIFLITSLQLVHIAGGMLLDWVFTGGRQWIRFLPPLGFLSSIPPLLFTFSQWWWFTFRKNLLTASASFLLLSYLISSYRVHLAGIRLPFVKISLSFLVYYPGAWRIASIPVSLYSAYFGYWLLGYLYAVALYCFTVREFALQEDW